MKILLLGEYSNVHWGLARGLRAIGHEVTVVSDGDGWKNYLRDIDLRRRSLGYLDTLRYLLDIQLTWPRLKGYDVVQLINPVFLDLQPERILPYYKKLRRQNGYMFLGSFGIDKPWVEEGLRPETFRYSDFYLYGERRDNIFIDEMQSTWLGTKGELFDYIAKDCDGLVAGLYENYRCCQPRYAEKLHFIPFPIEISNEPLCQPPIPPIRFFIGIQRSRNAYKGTDIMLCALERLQSKYPDLMQIVRAEDVPFAQYRQMLRSSHVLLDQLYSYTPAMNALEAMAKGMVVVGGAEPEHYEIMEEHELRPIVNVQPTEDDVVQQIETQLLQKPEAVATLSKQSIEYVRRHHDHVHVAKQYIKMWESIMK